MDRAITTTVDGSEGYLSDDGRPIFKTFSGGGQKDNYHHGRGSPKGSSGGPISTTFRRLWLFSIFAWAFTALMFAVVVHVGFRSGSCSTRAFIASVTGEEALRSSSSIALKHDQIANKFATEEDHNHFHAIQERGGGQEKEEEDTQLKQQHRVSSKGGLSSCDPYSQLTMVHLYQCAVHSGKKNERKTLALANAAPPGRVAFLFVTRGELPLEPLWKRFFKGHEELHSIYVHTSPHFSFENTSYFYKHQVPSESVERFQITLVDAVRRLLAHAILDPIHGASNSWFVLACESTIPIRSFNFTYNYLIKSQHSFVDSFQPCDQYLEWYNTASETPFAREKARKGEMWWAIQLRHALMVLEDWNIYYKYKRHCVWFCAPDEQYIPTLLGMKDPRGIENRTVHYVHWEDNHRSSPQLHEVADLTVAWFDDIQSRTMDRDGQYHDTSLDASQSQTLTASRECYYNGVANSTCFLFARKVAWEAREHLQSLPASVLGY